MVSTREALLRHALALLEVPKAPATKDQWENEAAALRERLRRALGSFPPRPDGPAETVETTKSEGILRKRLLIPAGEGVMIPALLEVCEGVEPRAAVINLPGHGDTKELGSERLGQELARKGLFSLSLDMRGHGEREEDLAAIGHFALWAGRSLMGLTVWDVICCVDHLLRNEQVARIGVAGWSMGGRIAWHAAALDERITCVAAMGCLTTWKSLITRDEWLPGSPLCYYPGRFLAGDDSSIARLVAPRPFLLAYGDQDVSVPQEGVDELIQSLGAVYGLYARTDDLHTFLYSGGHAFGPELAAKASEWLSHALAS